jgi:hypothetical protein
MSSGTTGNGQGMHGSGQSGSSSTGNVFQVSVSTRVAQSLFDITGLSIGAKYQKNITDETRYISSGTVLSGNDIFEDIYAYEGPTVEAMLTQQMPWNIRVNASASYQYKKYRNRPAYDLNQVVISSERIDKVTDITFSLEKDFKHIGFGVYYTYVNNISNDTYYNFKNNIITIGVNAGF